jgi:hypothetical protein
MAFSIKFLHDQIEDLQDGEKTSCGLITIGEFEERFIVPLNFWNASDYEKHWKNAIKRILINKSSCLITAMYNPKYANFINWWPLYREHGKVYIQNHILFFKELKQPFDPKNPFTFIPEHERTTEDGEKISEWVTSINDLTDYLSN